MSSVCELILERLETDPSREVIRDAGGAWSARDLLSTIRRIASSLSSQSVMAGDTVCIFMANSCEYIASMLACMHAGYVFVPLPHQQLNDRVISILKSSRAKVVLVRSNDPYADQLSSSTEAALLRVSRQGKTERKFSFPKVTDQSNVYCVFTSGTSGAPKGVLINGNNLASFVDSTISVFEFSPSTRALCISPFHFDGAFGSIFSVLTAGGSLVVSSAKLLSPAEFVNLCKGQKITHTSFSPSFLKLICQSISLQRLPYTPLKTIGLGGEDCRREDLIRFKGTNPSIRIFNRYGPTETTVVVASLELTTQVLASSEKIPFGKPSKGVEFLIVKDGDVCEKPGEVGELLIGGSQVMTGYMGDAALTEEVLERHLVPGKVFYKSGDLVYQNLDGNYVYTGRRDNIVNRNGVRISLVEISNAILSVPTVTDVVCLENFKNEATEIVAVVASIGNDMSLRAILQEKLPPQMMPDRIIIVDGLPRAESGKLDMSAIRNISRAFKNPATTLGVANG